MSSRTEGRAASIAHTIAMIGVLLAFVIATPFLMREAQKHGHTVILRGSGAPISLLTRDG